MHVRYSFPIFLPSNAVISARFRREYGHRVPAYLPPFPPPPVDRRMCSPTGKTCISPLRSPQSQSTSYSTMICPKPELKRLCPFGPRKRLPCWRIKMLEQGQAMDAGLASHWLRDLTGANL